MNLEPWYVTGLVEGEGCFCVSISKHKTKKLGFDARLMFEIEMIIDDKPLLEAVQKYFGCGQIYELNYERYGWRPRVKYAVKSQKDIFEKVIVHFEKYPLKGKKRKDFDYFCRAVAMFQRKQHLTEEGINKLRKIQLKMNIRKKLE
jgi:hypothetical protein